MKRLIFIFLFLILASGQAQSNGKADALIKKAILLMDNGSIDESIEVLEKAKKADPRNPVVLYEMGYAYYLSGNYEMAVKKVQDAITFHEVSDIYYQLLGNSYDLLGQPDSAITSYAMGIEKFPDSGRLYYESGVVKYGQKLYNDAIDFWEKGIKAEPQYPSNYYMLTKTFTGSKEKIWVLLYGEMFMNLEPGTERTSEISRILYDTYKNIYVQKNDSEGEFKLTEKGFTINVTDKDLDKIKEGGKLLPFEGEYALVFARAGTELMNQINLRTIVQTRKQFLKEWYGEEKHDLDFPNSLLWYQKQLLDKSYFESYSYWLLGEGDYEGFEAWLEANKVKYDKFIAFFTDDKLLLNTDDKFSRPDYFR
ncbi:tetratricopeptide repeat protein [Neptunitalea lumnitzerae]|uniref:Tetratricopeptide repeat protein n=1 Tax=Neptunitalea lumnitzerae TaxID=2965509 RepID=A0ABQ5MLA3_9FLAO|nr:tetratricopeptide repeat protein [Neptunitalea sp. Y10]GLB50174.1 hypothetical protein Y10_25420 [Neptunitalea sp. Y10]